MRWLVVLGFLLCSTAAEATSTFRKLFIMGGTGRAEYREAVLNLEPVAYWFLDEQAKGAAAEDAIGSFNGSYVNTPDLGRGALVPSQVAGGVATSVFFRDTPDEHMVTDGKVPLTVNYTLLFWLNTTNTPSSTADSPLDNLDGATDDNGWTVQINTLGQLRLSTGDDEGALTICTHAVDLTDGVTRFVAITASSNGGASIYIDGVVATSCAGMRIPNSSGVTPDFLRIGSSEDGRSFKGTMDEVALFNKVLSPLAIKTLYLLGVTP